MATKRQPSKQRRQSQNKAQRAALEKRRQNAEASGAPAAKAGGESTASATTKPKTSVLGRLTGTGRSSSGGGTTAKPRANAKPGAKQLPTGYRAALTAVFLAFVGLVFAATLKAPVDHQGEVFRTRDDKTADWAWAAGHAAVANPEADAADLAQDIDWQPGGSEAYVKAQFPYSLAIVLPLAAAVLAFWSVRKGATSKVINRCMYVTLFGALLTQQLALFFLPAAIAIGVAGFQIKKEELANAPSPPEPGDGVIDVDEVDDDVDGDDEDDVIEVDQARDDLAADDEIADDEPEDDEPEDDEPEDDEPEDDEPAEPVVRPRASGGLQLTHRPDDD